MARRYTIIFGTPKQNQKGEYLPSAIVIFSRGVVQDDFAALNWFEETIKNKDVQARLKRVNATKGLLLEVIDERSI